MKRKPAPSEHPARRMRSETARERGKKKGTKARHMTLFPPFCQGLPLGNVWKRPSSAQNTERGHLWRPDGYEGQLAFRLDTELALRGVPTHTDRCLL